MYKVTKRDCPMFGIGPYVCEFICDTASDISTLPTSISEGIGGKTVYDNQKCASGSIANVAENGAESKQYMLNNQDIWCPYSVASSSSDSVLEEAKAYTDSEIADLINGAPATRDTLKEIADAMAENQTVVEALNAAIGTKANKTDIPTSLPANGGNADTVDGLHANDFIKVNSSDAYDCNTLYDAGLYLCNGSATNTPNNLVYGTLLVMPYRKPYGNASMDYCAQIFIPNGDASDASMWYRTSLQNTWNEWKRTCDGGNADTLDGKHANEISSNPNLLINPDFKIKQRTKNGWAVDHNDDGTVNTSTQVYVMDRWRIMDGTITIADGKVYLSGTIIQVLENSIGSNFTASVSAESGTATASYDDSTKTFTIVGNSAVLNWAKLEYGSVATPFVTPDPTLELIKCQRFFYRKRNITGYFGCGYCENPRDAYITFPLFMRIAPTVNYNGLMIFSKDKTVAHDTTSTSYSITGATGHLCNFGVRINFTVDISSKQMSAGCAAMLIATTPGDHGGYFELDAEIY